MAFSAKPLKALLNQDLFEMFYCSLSNFLDSATESCVRSTKFLKKKYHLPVIGHFVSRDLNNLEGCWFEGYAGLNSY